MRKFSRRFMVVAAGSALAAAVMIIAIVAAASARPRARTVHESSPTTSTAIRATASTTSTTLRRIIRRPPTTTTTMPARTLAEGSTGADVVSLQIGLARHGYWLVDEPGTFGPATGHAVVAFEKAMGLPRDGIVDPAERNQLRTANRFQPRSTTGRVFEVDLQRQILLDVDNGHVTWVFDASTGRVPGSTPTGNFHVYQQVDGWVHGTLGTLYRPKFFAGNVGIHGSPSIPPYPASHGCVRMFNAAMDWIWASGDLPMGTEVWVY